MEQLNKERELTREERLEIEEKAREQQKLSRCVRESHNYELQKMKL